MAMHPTNLNTTIEQLWQRYISGAAVNPDPLIYTALRCGFLSGVTSIMSYMRSALGDRDVPDEVGADKMDALYNEALELLKEEVRKSH